MLTAEEAVDRLCDQMEEYIYGIFRDFPKVSNYEMIGYLIAGLYAKAEIVKDEINEK